MADRVDLYAEALSSVVRAEDPTGIANDELYRVARLFESSDELRQALTDTSVPVARRQQAVETLLSGQVQPVTLGIVSLLVAAGRIADLPRIADSMAAQAASAASKRLAEVRSAVPLSDDQQRRLAAALEKAAGGPVDVKVVVDPSVLGGIVAQIGDTVIDGSVRSRLSKLRDVF
jgi:F-type H+-transporting ATPase subunit delta